MRKMEMRTKRRTQLKVLKLMREMVKVLPLKSRK